MVGRGERQPGRALADRHLPAWIPDSYWKSIVFRMHHRPAEIDGQELGQAAQAGVHQCHRGFHTRAAVPVEVPGAPAARHNVTLDSHSTN